MQGRMQGCGGGGGGGKGRGGGGVSLLGDLKLLNLYSTATQKHLRWVLALA